MSNYTLCKLINATSNTIQLENLKTGEKLNIKMSRTVYYSPNSLVVLQNGVKVHKYRTEFRGLYTEYQEYTKFKLLIKSLKNAEKYRELYERGTSIRQIYLNVLGENLDQQFIKIINKAFSKSKTIRFRIIMPVYIEQFRALIDRLPDISKNIRYLAKDEFYIPLSFNSLIEKPYTKFYEIFGAHKAIDLQSIKIS